MVSVLQKAVLAASRTLEQLQRRHFRTFCLLMPGRVGPSVGHAARSALS